MNVVTRLLLCCGIAGVFLAGVAAAAPPSGSLPPDADLERPITIDAGKTPLFRLLRDVQAQTGTELRASEEVRDDPVIVYVREQPARRVLDTVQQLLQYRWRRVPGRTKAYELCQDLSARSAEERLREAARKAALERLRAAVRECGTIARRPPAELLREADLYDDLLAAGNGDAKKPGVMESGAERSPFRAMMERDGGSRRVRELAGSHWRFLARAVAGLGAREWKVLESGSDLVFSTRPEPDSILLSPRVAGEIRGLQPAMFPPGMRVRFGQPDGAAIQERLDGLGRSQWANATAYRLRVRFQEQRLRGRRSASLELVLSTVLPPGFEREQQVNPGPLRIGSEDAPGDPQPSPGAAPEANDPVLDRVAEIDAGLFRTNPRDVTVDWLNQLLPAVARAYDIQLIADAYRHPRVRLPQGSGPARLSLREVLRQYVEPLARWRRSGTLFTVRRTQWYEDRAAEVPYSFAEAWAERLRQRPELTPEDLAAIAVGLRDEALETLPATLRERGIEMDQSYELYVVRQVAFLRAYGNLQPWQRQLLRTGGEVSYGSMSREARFWIDRAIRERRPGENAALPPGTLRAPVLRRQVRETATGYSVTYSRADRPGPPVATQTIRKDGAAPSDADEVRDLMFEYRLPDGSTFYFTLYPPAVSPVTAPTGRAPGSRPGG